MSGFKNFFFSFIKDTKESTLRVFNLIFNTFLMYNHCIQIEGPLSPSDISEVSSYAGLNPRTYSKEKPEVLGNNFMRFYSFESSESTYFNIKDAL